MSSLNEIILNNYLLTTVSSLECKVLSVPRLHLLINYLSINNFIDHAKSML
jgi:hypothetical protein